MPPRSGSEVEAYYEFRGEAVDRIEARVKAGASLIEAAFHEFSTRGGRSRPMNDYDEVDLRRYHTLGWDSSECIRAEGKIWCAARSGPNIVISRGNPV